MADPISGGEVEALAPIRSRDFLFTVGLAWLAGFNDGVTFTMFGSYVSFMSGNLTEVGSMAGFDAALVCAALFALVSFTLGAMLGDYLVDASDGWGRTIVMFGEALAIVVAALVTSADGGKAPLLSILAFAMGIQNSALHRHSGVSVAVTGTIARLGRVLGHVLQKKAPIAFAGPPALLLLFWVSGACLGGLAARLGIAFALWISASLVLGLLAWSIADKDLRQRPLASSF